MKKIVGEALNSVRKEVVIASKIGFDIDFGTAQMKAGLNSKPTHIKQAVDFMLKRLQTPDTSMNLAVDRQFQQTELLSRVANTEIVHG